MHSTRKSCGSLLAALDVHSRVAVQILRHSKIAITMEIYTEAVSAATRDALRKLGERLGPRLRFSRSPPLCRAATHCWYCSARVQDSGRARRSAWAPARLTLWRA